MEFFDECFESHPDLSEKPVDFEDFWSNRIADLRKVPVETSVKRRISRKILSENNYSISFQSAGKYRIQGHFLAPKKLIGKPPVVVIFQDYLQPQTGFKALTNAGIAQLTINLRGHEDLELMTTSEKKNEETKSSDTAEASKVTEIPVKKGPGFFSENLVAPEESYISNLYLDAFRTVEVARLRRETDSGKIGIWGRGTGCAMALMVASQMKRATALYLEKPSMCNLPLSLKHSDGIWADELKDGLKKGAKRNRKKLQDNAKYLDALYFADKVNIPVAMAVSLTEDIHDPRSAFSLFHLLKDEKDMYLFTQDDPVAKANEKRKVIQNGVKFFSKLLLEKELEDETKIDAAEQKE